MVIKAPPHHGLLYYQYDAKMVGIRSNEINKATKVHRSSCKRILHDDKTRKGITYCSYYWYFILYCRGLVSRFRYCAYIGREREGELP